jgi:hypothetical protein
VLLVQLYTARHLWVMRTWSDSHSGGDLSAAIQAISRTACPASFKLRVTEN